MGETDSFLLPRGLRASRAGHHGKLTRTVEPGGCGLWEPPEHRKVRWDWKEEGFLEEAARASACY